MRSCGALEKPRMLLTLKSCLRFRKNGRPVHKAFSVEVILSARRTVLKIVRNAPQQNVKTEEFYE